jgi:hypothetical protein
MQIRAGPFPRDLRKCYQCAVDTSLVYVDGTFQVELPPGEVYVEMTKGLLSYSG